MGWRRSENIFTVRTSLLTIHFWIQGVPFFLSVLLVYFYPLENTWWSKLKQGRAGQHSCLHHLNFVSWTEMWAGKKSSKWKVNGKGEGKFNFRPLHHDQRTRACSWDARVISYLPMFLLLSFFTLYQGVAITWFLVTKFLYKIICGSLPYFSAILCVEQSPSLCGRGEYVNRY